MIKPKHNKIKGAILLTSTGLSSQNIKNKFNDLVKNLNKSIAIITSADEEKERGYYAKLVYNEFLKIGFTKVDFVDFENYIDVDLSAYNIFYVGCGSTFELLKSARLVDFKTSVKNLLDRGGVYIGVSAGSIILGPSIAIASIGDEPDINDINLEDLSGLNLVDSPIYPHYNKESEIYIKEFEDINQLKVIRIPNNQALLIKDGKEELI